MEQMDFFEEDEMSEVTVSSLDKLCEEYAEMRLLLDEKKQEIKAKTEELEAIETKIIEALTQSGKNSWDSRAGKVVIQTRYTVAVPKTPEERKKFFDYLKEKGDFDNLITVNSQSLNAYNKQEMEHALENGDVNFKIPGLGEPSMAQFLQLRKGK